MQMYSKMALMITLVGALAACDRSNDSHDSSQTSTDIVISGNLVVPANNNGRYSEDKIENTSSPSNCSALPAGYIALDGARVEIKGQIGEVLSRIVTTDPCGAFAFSVDEHIADQAVQVSAKKAGFKNIDSHVDNFIEGSHLKVASTISNDASYEISGLTKLSDDEVNLVITDTVSHKAVIGIMPEDLSFEKNSIPLTNSSVIGASNTLDNSASIVISLDSSTSMATNVFDDGEVVVDKNGDKLTRYIVAANAAHQFVETTKINAATSQFAILPFSTESFPLTDDLLAKNLEFKDKNGDRVKFVTNDNGAFITDSATVHTLIDIYNPYSDMYPTDSLYDDFSSAKIEKYNKREDNIDSISVRYPFNGVSAFYDNLANALEQFESTMTNPRVIVLTDGDDINSRANDNDVITKAVDLNIPISIVSIDSGLSHREEMVNVAEKTGSQYIELTDATDLVDTFEALSTQTSFNYSVELGEEFISGDSLKATVDINGEVINREVIVQ